MTIICSKTYAGHQFNWNGCVGTADISDLCDGGNLELDARVYDDACDVGFYVTSQKTGRRVLFIESNVARDGEGDVMYNEYVSINPNCMIRVFND
ncbi:MAG: hypothetical protein ACHQU0_03890 [Candidatus Paceibacteria bacterium]